MSTLAPHPDAVVYPDSDGKPMADNNIQFRWIVTIQGNLDAAFRDRPDVYVAGDHLIYPVQGNPGVCTAPDVYVAFGRPKGDRGSYRVWDEDGVFPQVVFEVLSPSNTVREMREKRGFYRRFGAEEYYVYDPDTGEVEGYTRSGRRFLDVDEMNGWVSPRLGVRFDTGGQELVMYRPDGSRFLTFDELDEERMAERLRADAEKKRADREKRRADAEKQRADAEAAAKAKLAAKLRELGVDPEAV